MAVSSSLPNILAEAAAAERGSSTVRPEVSMRWMTRWSSTIFCFARSRMSSSTLPLVRNLLTLATHVHTLWISCPCMELCVHEEGTHQISTPHDYIRIGAQLLPLCGSQGKVSVYRHLINIILSGG